VTLQGTFTPKSIAHAGRTQGWRLRHRVSDASLGARFTVILRGERMPGTRRTARRAVLLALRILSGTCWEDGEVSRSFLTLSLNARHRPWQGHGTQTLT